MLDSCYHHGMASGYTWDTFDAWNLIKGAQGLSLQEGYAKWYVTVSPADFVVVVLVVVVVAKLLGQMFALLDLTDAIGGSRFSTGMRASPYLILGIGPIPVCRAVVPNDYRSQCV